MRVIMTGAVAAALLSVLSWMPVQAAEDGRTKQQELMASCNKMAGTKELKGDDRKKFMSSCLKGEVPAASAPAKLSPQERMGECNRQAGAKELKGDDRKAFMSSCLKG
ncbi:MAG: PsiF family protein [Pseudomonadota bacterium]|jgi:hypothetical protein